MLFGLGAAHRKKKDKQEKRTQTIDPSSLSFFFLCFTRSVPDMSIFLLHFRAFSLCTVRLASHPKVEASLLWIPNYHPTSPTQINTTTHHLHQLTDTQITLTISISELPPLAVLLPLRQRLGRLLEVQRVLCGGRFGVCIYVYRTRRSVSRVYTSHKRQSNSKDKQAPPI